MNMQPFCIISSLLVNIWLYYRTITIILILKLKCNQIFHLIGERGHIKKIESIALIIPVTNYTIYSRCVDKSTIKRSYT